MPHDDQKIALQTLLNGLHRIGAISHRDAMYSDRREELVDHICRFAQEVERITKKNLNIPVEGEDIGHECVCYVVKDRKTGQPKIKQVLISYAANSLIPLQRPSNGNKGNP